MQVLSKCRYKMSGVELNDSATRGCIYLACCTYAMQNEVRDDERNERKQALLRQLIQDELFKRIRPEDQTIYVPLRRVAFSPPKNHKA